MARLIFITGGAASGKSRYAQRLAETHAGGLLYVATAEIGDDEMAARVRRHREERGERWQTLEEPLALAEQLPPAAGGVAAVLVDCVTLWLTNLMLTHHEEPARIWTAVERFLVALQQLDSPVYLVSNEVGGGIVPENRLARDFRDLAGKVNQRLAEAADEAWQVVAGLPLRLK